MDLLQLPKTALRVQWRLVRLPLTLVETVTRRDQASPAPDDTPDVARAGLVDTLVGRAKEVAGIVMGDDDLLTQGRLQQVKGERERDAAIDEAIAEQIAERAEDDYEQAHDEVQERRAAVAREAVRRTAAVQGERRQHEAEIERRAARRQEAVEQAAETRKQQAAKKQATAARKRAERAAAVRRTEQAADEAKRTAEALRAARR